MVRAILFGVAIIGGVYIYEIQTGKDFGVSRTITAVARGFSGGYGTSLGTSGGASGGISGAATGAGGLVTGALSSLGN